MNIDVTLSEDRANIFSDLRAIANHCLSTHRDSKKAFNLLYTIWENVSGDLWTSCYWSDYSRCGQIVLRVAREVENIQIQAQLLGELGYTCLETGDFARAQEYFQESLQKYQYLQDFHRESTLLRYLGNLHLQQGQSESALEYYHRAREVLETNRNHLADDRLAYQEAELQNVMGFVYLDLQKFPESYEQLHLSLKNYRDLIKNHPKPKTYYTNYRYYLADPLLNLGRWHFLSGDYPQAQNYYQECLLLCQEINRNDTMSGVLLSLAELAEVEGDLDRAIALATEAEQVAGTEIRTLRDRAASYKERLQVKLVL
ncbi:MAG: tetratricopeptide repeat protein [Coleofasciculaceae cyanobacterium SM2_1_6]|nr:tetratricopeptide repeat protein [Coleofasciculaceae cyanobacterium SM2_1_6]